MAKVPTTTKSSRADDRRRGARVGQRVREELTLILAQEVGDPRAQGVVISGVDVTDDVSLARVAFVVMGDTPDGAKAAAALKVLKRLTATLRTKLAPRLAVRRMPVLEFHIDTGREDVQRIDAVLYEVAQELKATSDKPEG